MLDIALLGTGGMMPLPQRWLSSVLVRCQSNLLLFDSGEGTQISQKALGWGFKAVSTICISHFHADHVGGLPGMLLMIGNSGRTEPLTILGPPGLEQVVAGLRTIAPYLPYAVHCLVPAPGQVVERDGVRIRAAAVDHSLPCQAYSLEVPRARAFLPERARALGLPLPLWAQLQHGEAVELAGRQVVPDEVLGPPRPGLRLVYVTDTRPTPDLPAFVGGADLLVCEGTYGDPADLPKAIEHKHMTFAEAAELARAGQAKQLWLSHFSPALDEPQRFADHARAIFPDAVVGYDHLQTTLRFEDRRA